MANEDQETEADSQKLSEKAEAFGALSPNTSWYAACQSGHAFWAGADRNSYGAAQADATAHDRARHGGSSTAVVINS